MRNKTTVKLAESVSYSSLTRSDINWTDEGFEVPSECWQLLFQHSRQGLRVQKTPLSL